MDNFTIKIINNKFPVVKVIWSDSNIWGDQRKIDSDFNITNVETVGYLIKQDEVKVVVARDYFSKENDVRGAVSIPTENIIKQEIVAP